MLQQSRSVFTLLALMAATLLVGAGPAGVRPWAGPERQVSATGMQPVVAVDGRGNFIVVWMELDKEDPQHLDVYAQRFSAAGPKLGEPFRVNATTAGDQIYPVVAADRAGNFVVVWQGGYTSSYLGPPPGGDGSGSGIFLQRFAADGRRLGRELRANRPTEGDQVDPRVAMAPDGRFAVAWIDLRTLDRVSVRAFAAAGRPAGEQVLLEPGTGRDAGRDAQTPLLAMAADGSFAVGWTETYEYHCPEYQCVDFLPYVQVLGPDSRPRGGRRLLDDGRFGILQALLAPAGGGDFLALWSQAGAPGLAGQRIAASGQKVGSRLRLAYCPSGNCPGFAAADIDAAGRLVLISEQGTIGGPVSLFGQLFDPNGTALGPLFPVSGRPSTWAEYPAVALAEDGTFAVVWERRSDTDPRAGAIRRWFRRP